MPTYHDPEDAPFTSEALAREAAQPISDRIAQRMAEIRIAKTEAQAAERELQRERATQATEQATEEAERAAAAEQLAMSRSALQHAIADYMRSEARTTAQYITGMGIEPTVAVDSDRTDEESDVVRCWVLGILRTETPGNEVVYKPGTWTHKSNTGADIPLGTAPIVSKQQYRGIGLLASGDLIPVDDFSGYYKHGKPAIGASIEVNTIGNGVVTNDMLVPLTRVVALESLPQNQSIALHFRSQLETLGAHALSRTMPEYAPYWTTVSIDPYDKPDATINPLLGSVF